MCSYVVSGGRLSVLVVSVGSHSHSHRDRLTTPASPDINTVQASGTRTAKVENLGCSTVCVELRSGRQGGVLGGSFKDDGMYTSTEAAGSSRAPPTWQVVGGAARESVTIGWSSEKRAVSRAL